MHNMIYLLIRGSIDYWGKYGVDIVDSGMAVSHA